MANQMNYPIKQDEVDLLPPNSQITNQIEMENGKNEFSMTNILLLDGIFDIFITLNGENTLHCFGESVNKTLISDEMHEKMAKQKLNLSVPHVFDPEYVVLIDHVKMLHSNHNMNYQQFYALCRNKPDLNVAGYHQEWFDMNHLYISEKVPKIGHIFLFANIAKRINNKNTMTHHIGVFGLYYDIQIFAVGVLYIMQHLSHLINSDKATLNNVFTKCLYYNSFNGVKLLRSKLNAPIKYSDNGYFGNRTGFTCTSTWTEIMCKATNRYQDQNDDDDMKLLQMLSIAYKYGDIEDYDILNSKEIIEIYSAYSDNIKHDKKYRKEMVRFIQTLQTRHINKQLSQYVFTKYIESNEQVWYQGMDDIKIAMDILIIRKQCFYEFVEKHLKYFTMINVEYMFMCWMKHKMEKLLLSGLCDIFNEWLSEWRQEWINIVDDRFVTQSKWCLFEKRLMKEVKCKHCGKKRSGNNEKLKLCKKMQNGILL